MHCRALGIYLPHPWSHLAGGGAYMSKMQALARWRPCHNEAWPLHSCELPTARVMANTHTSGCSAYSLCVWCPICSETFCAPVQLFCVSVPSELRCDPFCRRSVVPASAAVRSPRLLLFQPKAVRLKGVTAVGPEYSDGYTLA